MKKIAAAAVAIGISFNFAAVLRCTAVPVQAKDQGGKAQEAKTQSDPLVVPRIDVQPTASDASTAALTQVQQQLWNSQQERWQQNQQIWQRQTDERLQQQNLQQIQQIQQQQNFMIRGR